MHAYGPLQKIQDRRSAKLRPEPGTGVEWNLPVEDLHRRLVEAEARAARAEGERDALRELADNARQDAAAWRERADRADRLLANLRVSSGPARARPWWRFRRSR